MNVPPSTRYLIIGAGVHGLSTAYHLARELKARGQGGGEDILVVDKTGVAAGASGIACGVVRNNYYQPAMAELMAANVEVWEEDAAAYAYNSVGYMALGPQVQEQDLIEVHERQQRIGYPSDLIVGEREVREYMRGLYPDWRGRGVTVCLHEHKGGFAYNVDAIQGLARKARGEGVQILEGVRVTGFEMDGSGAVTTVETDAGSIAVDQVVVGAGPWIKEIWGMLDLPQRLDVRTPTGEVHRDREMWTFWYLQEGEITMDPTLFATAQGGIPPVIHVDSDAPLHDDDGKLITDELWGIYFKRDRHGVQGGASPLPKGHDFEVDPYPTSSVEPGFADMWVAALSHCMERFAGLRSAYKTVRSGGVGAFTVDNFPVFDEMRPRRWRSVFGWM